MNILSYFLTFYSFSGLSLFQTQFQKVDGVINTTPISVSTTTSMKKFIPFNELSHYENLDHFSEKANHVSEEIGKNIVLSVSSGLPKFDSVGHNILSANHDFIADILKNELLSQEMKKNIILASIKLAQMGDDMGSHILQYYYNLVESCL